jgi:hypothetical protein
MIYDDDQINKEVRSTVIWLAAFALIGLVLIEVIR